MSAPLTPNGFRTQTFDNSACAFLAPPSIGVDLNEGFERCVWRDPAKSWKEGLDGLVLGLKRLEAQNGGQKVLGEGKEGIVTWRGVLTKLITAPYEDRDSFELNAILAPDNNIYIENHKPPETIQNTYGENPKHKLMTYYGYSFESYATTPSTPTKPSLNAPRGWSTDVDTNSEWCAVVKSSLDGVRLVLGGEVDCVEGEYNGSLANAVELKTNRLIRSERDAEFFEKKLLKHWAQSFLLSIPTIVVGFRSDRPPKIQSVQRFRTMEIPRLVRGKKAGWDPAVCLQFGGEVLRFIRQVAQDESPAGEKVVWRIKFTPSEGFEMRTLSTEEINVLEEGRPVGSEDGGRSRWGFLPGWMGPAESSI